METTIDINSKSSWEKILVKLTEEVKSDSACWYDYPKNINKGQVGVHLAVFIEPFLGFIMDGTKTVESRFSIKRFAPFEAVYKNDIILLKKVSGPIIGLCSVSHVWNFNIKPETWKTMRNEFSESLCAQDPEFWDQRKDAKYATLIGIENVIGIRPVKVNKRDRRGWVVLNKSSGIE